MLVCQRVCRSLADDQNESILTDSHIMIDSVFCQQNGGRNAALHGPKKRAAKETNYPLRFWDWYGKPIHLVHHSLSMMDGQ